MRNYFLKPVQNNKLPDVEHLLVKWLSRPSINALDNLGYTPINRALEYGYMNIAKLLIEKGANVNIKNNFGNSPLHFTANKNDEEMVQLLIKCIDKTSINGQDNQGNTPLHNALENGYIKIAKLLIREGADINIKNNSGNSPLHFAVYENCKEVVQLLIENYANIHSNEVLTFLRTVGAPAIEYLYSCMESGNKLSVHAMKILEEIGWKPSTGKELN